MLIVVFLVFFNLIVIENMFSNDIKKSQSLITGAAIGINGVSFNTLFLIIVNLVVIVLLIYSLRKIDRKKGQMSIETIGVYSWALVALVIVASGFYFYNVFDPSRYMEEQCNIVKGISCLDSVVNTTGHGVLVLENDIGNDLNNVDLKVDNCNNVVVANFQKNKIINFWFDGCGILEKDSKFDTNIMIIYNVGSETYQKSGVLKTTIQGGVIGVGATTTTTTTITSTTTTTASTTTTTTLPGTTVCNGRGTAIDTAAISPTTSWQTISSSLSSSSDTKRYQVSVTSTGQHEFSLCTTDGGTSSYDSYLCLFNSNKNNIASDDDGCSSIGGPSQSAKITYSIGSTGTYYIQVSGYSNAFGSYTLAYRRTPSSCGGSCIVNSDCNPASGCSYCVDSKCQTS